MKSKPTSAMILGTSLVVAGFLPTLAMAAAATRADGQWLFLLPLAYNEADERFNEDGDKVPIDPFEMVEVSPFIEYGVTDSFTLGMQPKWRRVTIETEEGEVTNEGLAETDIWARQRLWKDESAVFSIQGLVKAPVEPDEDHPAALGRDQVDTELSLQFGDRIRRDGGGSFFYNLELGYRWRFEGLDDQVLANAYLGWGFNSGWTLILRSANTLGNPDTNDEFSEVLTGGPSFRRHDAQLIASFGLTDSTTLVAGASTTYAGEDIGAGDTAFLSLLFQSQ